MLQNTTANNAQVGARCLQRLALATRNALLVGCLLAQPCCGTSRSYVWVGDYATQRGGRPARPIHPGDRIQIVVKGQDGLGAIADVRPDGEVVLPVVGSVVAASKSPADLANDIARRLQGIVQSPNVLVIVERRRTVVSVIGEVRTNGRFELEPNEGVLQALARAGGLTQFADGDHIFVLRREPQPTRIRFRYSDLSAAEPASSSFELHDGDTILVE